MNKRTAVFKSEVFLAHEPGWGHVESPERLQVIYDELARPEIAGKFSFPAFGPAPREILALNHTAAHIARVAATAGKPFEVLDPDTHTSPRSYEAACLAAGAVVAAVNMVAGRETDNAMALVRPPGHHAEADHTSGFCLFNNIAIGAHYALKRLGMERILIVDWDLHHGNGTQHAFYDTDRVLYFSTHQYPYFPGTGSLQEVGSGAGKGYTLNVPLSGGQNDAAYARIFNELLAPVARQYRPDCILVSAGYDTYLADPLGTMAVTREGFAYMTGVLLELAGDLCEGRLVLVLEGGYNFDGLKSGVLASLTEMTGESILPSDRANRLRSAEIVLPALDQALAVAKNYWTF
jgi:acetoin utilization deacetylase AcuC-like enzyme